MGYVSKVDVVLSKVFKFIVDHFRPHYDVNSAIYFRVVSSEENFVGGATYSAKAELFYIWRGKLISSSFLRSTVRSRYLAVTFLHTAHGKHT